MGPFISAGATSRVPVGLISDAGARVCHDPRLSRYRELKRIEGTLRFVVYLLAVPTGSAVSTGGSFGLHPCIPTRGWVELNGIPVAIEDDDQSVQDENDAPIRLGPDAGIDDQRPEVTDAVEEGDQE